MFKEKENAGAGDSGAYEGDACEQHPANSKAKNKTQAAIRAELAWSDTATARGIVARGSTPVLNLCRQLVEAGHDPRLPLEAWRGGTLCLHVRSIGEAAGLQIGGNGVGFRCPEEVGTAPPMRLNNRGGT